MTQCTVCKAEADCRPYMPNGGMICFYCGMLPERKAATEAAFASQLDACGDVAVINFDSEAGPYPYSKVRS